MRAKDVMSNGVISIMADATVFEAAELLVGAQVSAVPGLDSTATIVGIVSEADLIRRAEIGTAPHKSWLLRMLADDFTTASEYVHSHSRRVKDVMTKAVITTTEDATLGEVAELMAKHNVKRIPVVRDGTLAGIVSRSNLLQALMWREPKTVESCQPDEELRHQVLEAVQKHSWASSGLTNVFVSESVVHLWGYVPNVAIHKAYRVAAENVPGVRVVKNHMRTMPASVHMGV